MGRQTRLLTYLRKTSAWLGTFLLLLYVAVHTAKAQVSLTATGGIPTGTYATLSAAFAAINAGTHTGAITLTITANITEPAIPTALNASGVGLCNYTSVLINTNGVFTVSGPGSAGRGLVEFDGADNVTIDGDWTGGGTARDLTFQNNSTLGGTAVIRFIGENLVPKLGATNSTVRNCIIRHNSTAAVFSFGVFIGGATIGSTGTCYDCDNLTIDNNWITNCAVGINAIGVGTASLGMINNLSIRNNQIGDPAIWPTASIGAFFCNLRSIENSPRLLENNEMSGLFTTVLATRLAIQIGGGATAPVRNSTINRNRIFNVVNDDIADDGYGIVAMSLNAGALANDTIRNNTFGNINSDGTFGLPWGNYALDVVDGSDYKIYHNTFRLSGVRLTSIGPYTPSTCVRVRAAATLLDVRNNLFCNTNVDITPGVNTCFAFFVDAPGTFGQFTVFNNNYFGASNSFGGLGGTGTGYPYTAYTTLPALQTNFGGNLASTAETFTFPLTNFVSVPSNLRLNVPLIPPATAALWESRGDATIGVTDDIDGLAQRIGPGGCAPDIGADEAGMPLINPSITYTPLPAQSYSVLPACFPKLAATIAPVAGCPGTVAPAPNDPRLYFKKSTNANTLGATNDNTSDGWKYVNATSVVGTTYNFTINLNLLFGGFAAGDNIEYFVCAEGIPASFAVNTATFAVAPTTVNLTAANFPVTGTINNFNLVNYLSGVVTIGGVGAPPANFPTLTGVGGLFEYINTYGLGGNVTANIVADIAEPGTVALNEWVEAPCPAGPFSLLIQPSGGSRILSGNRLDGLIRLNGADRVTINGNLGGSRGLTINNILVPASFSWAPVIAILPGTGGVLPGANNITITNCNINGSGSTTSSMIGIYAGNTPLPNTGGGNSDNLTITNNQILSCWAGMIINGTAIGLLDNVIVNDNIVGPATAGATDVGAYGIIISNAVAPQILRNTLQNLNNAVGVAAKAIWLGVFGATTNSLVELNNIGPMSSDNNAYAIEISNVSSTGSIINRNKIFNLTAGSTGGGWGAKGVALNFTNVASNTRVTNNFISGINGDSWATTFPSDVSAGIWVNGAGGARIQHNSVNITGSRLNPGTNVVVAGLQVTAGAGLDVRNNIFVNTFVSTGSPGSRSYGVHSAVAAPFTQINNNCYGAGATPGSGQSYTGFLTTQRATIVDWRLATGQDAASFNDMPIFVSANDLHLNYGTLPSSLESAGATLVPPITDDIDGLAQRVGPPGSVLGGGFAPDIGADEVDMVPSVIKYLALPNSACPPTFRAYIRTSSGVPAINDATFKPRLYFIKNLATNVNSFIDNTNLTPGWKYVEGNRVGTTDSFEFTFNYALLHNAPVVRNDVINYFVVAQDVNPVPGVYANLASFATPPTSVALVPANFPIYDTRQFLKNGLEGVLRIPGDFANFTGGGGVFDAINNEGLVGNVVIEFTGNFRGAFDIYTGQEYWLNNTGEPGTIALNEWTEHNCGAPRPYRVLIRPGQNNRVPQIVWGSLTGGMIKFNAADRVTIDGRIGTRRNMLVFANAANSYAAADVQLMTPTATTNGSRDFAIFNTSFWGWTGLLRLDVFQGNPTNVHGGYAIAIGGTTVGTSGANHDSIIIENNTISGIGRGIFSGATTVANSNDTLIIRNNTFGGFTAVPAFIVQERGVEATRVNQLVIENNQFLNISKDAPQFAANQSFGASLNTCNFVTFDNNQFRNISNFSAQANGLLATACTNMSIDRNSFNRIYAPLSNAFGINLGAGTANVTVTKNYIADVIANSNLNSTAVGIEVATNLTTANIKLHNNMIANVVGRGQTGPNASIAGIRLTNVNGNIEILHNSVGLSGVYQGTGNRITAALAIGTPVTALNVQNNIFANQLLDLSPGGGTSRSYAVHCLSTAAGAFGTLGGINFNNYWVGTTPGVGQFFTGFLGVNRALVSDWSAATGYDAQSFSIDPEFVSSTDLHARSTIMNDRGTTGFLPQVPQDIDNQNRPFSGSILPDVGADDYTPLSIDLAANGWVNPVGTCFTGLNPVQIRVKNYGSGSGSTVDLVLVPGVTEITVTGTIIYPSGLSTPYSRTFNTGSIAPSGTMILDLFPGGLDLTTEGTYTFLNFQVYVTGDQNLGNNGFSTFVINNRRPRVTVTASPNKFNQCIDNNATVRARVETRPYFFSQNVSQAIADWGTTVSTLNVTLPPGVTANELDTVTINLLHTWNSDLRIRLQAPDGTIYRICDGIGGSGDNFVNAQFAAGGIIPPAGNYTVRSLPSPPFSPYVPLDPFTSYTGPATGVWRLIIDDLFFQDDGTLLNWRLSFRNDVNVNWVVTGAAPLPVLTPSVPTTVTSVWTDNENFTFSSAGTRTFKLQAVDAFGCAASAEADIEVELANTPDAPTIPDTIRVCKGMRAVIEPKYAPDSRAQFAFHIDNVRDTLFAAARTKQIPDLSEVRDTINVGIPVQIPASELVAVNVDIVHPRVGDLQLYLISPSGVSVTLSLNNGGNGANYTNTMFTPYASDPISAGTPPFSRRYLPQQPFTLFTGNAQGNWQLRIVDTSAIGGTQGYLVGWSLQFRSQFLVANRYITGPLFEDTVIWVSTVLGRCLSKNMRGVAIEVLPPPNIPQPLTLPRICAGQQITINPQFNDSDKVFDRTFYWFRSQQDSLPFHIGRSYTTPKLTAPETYFIATVFSGCQASPRRQIQVDVNPYPDLPIVPFAEACFGQSGTLVATSGTPGVRYNWYQSEDAPTPFFSGSIYLTTPAFKDSIFWVESFDGGCPSEKRVSVKLTVKPNPDAPKIIKADTFVCIGSRANMYAFSNNTVEWYDLETGGTLLKRGADFDTLVDQNTTFWAQSKLGNCVSKRVPVTIRVGAKQPPLAVPTLPAVACKGGTTNLTARVDSGSTIWWFRDRQSAIRFTNGVVGNSYQTPFMSESDTFWIVTNNGICRSAPVPVPVSVEPEPTIRLSIAGGSPAVVQRQNFTVVASVEPKGSKIIWELAPGVDYYTKSDSELVVAFNNIGKQSIRVRALNGECEKVITGSVEVLAQTGVVDKIVGVDFRVYPNPTRGMVSLQLDQDVSTPFTIEIIDGAGKQVYNESVDATNSYEKQYDFSKLGAGVYTVILRREGASLISRVVVQ